MELTPIAKPVRIRVKISGNEYNSLSEVRENFSLKELYPMYKDGRLERWLGQIGEQYILNRVRSLKEKSENFRPEENDSKQHLRNYLDFLAIFNEQLNKIVNDLGHNNSIESIIYQIGRDDDISIFLYNNLTDVSLDWYLIVDLRERDIKDLKTYYNNFFLQKLFVKEWPDLFRKKMTLDDALQLYNTHRLIFDDWGSEFAILIKTDYELKLYYTEILAKLCESDSISFCDNIFKYRLCKTNFETLLSVLGKANELNLVTNNLVVALAKKTNSKDDAVKVLDVLKSSHKWLMLFSTECDNYNFCTLIEDELWESFKAGEKWDNYRKTIGYLMATFKKWGNQDKIPSHFYETKESEIKGWYESPCYVEIQTTLLIRDIVSIFEFGNITRLEEIQLLPDRFNTLTDSCLLRLRDIMSLKYRYRKKEIDAGYVLSEFEKMGDDFSDLQRFVYNKFTSYWSMASRVIGYILRIKQ